MDADGYPEEHELVQIAAWPHDDWDGLLVYVADLWRWPEFGWHEYKDRDGARVFALSTGGWSGNEDLIAAMQENRIFWMMNWKVTRSGGHYLLRVRELERDPDPFVK